MTNEAPKGRGRPKKDKRQASFNDMIIEDGDVAALLEEIADGEAVAIRVRQAKRELKKLVEVGYPEVINADRDGEHSGYVLCDHFRFWAGKTDVPEREQKAKRIPSRSVWAPLDVHKLDLFNAAPVD